MKLARFWTRQPGEAVGPGGQRIRVVSRGWSNDSKEAAAALARDMAGRVAERIASGRQPAREYQYGERPLPEPILRQFADGAGGPRAVVTRNLYGALVLNTQDLMFVDIDRDSSRGTGQAGDLVSSVMSLFGRKAAPAQPPGDPVVADVQRVAERHGRAVRIYITAAGYRAIVTNIGFQSDNPQTEALLREFGADPLYIRLCKMQQSFRARLTPKPWRAGLGTPPVSFPFETPQEEGRFRSWEASYTATIARFATCKYVAHVGAGGIAPRSPFAAPCTRSSAVE